MIDKEFEEDSDEAYIDTIKRLRADIRELLEIASGAVQYLQIIFHEEAPEDTRAALARLNAKYPPLH